MRPGPRLQMRPIIRFKFTTERRRVVEAGPPYLMDWNPRHLFVFWLLRRPRNWIERATDHQGTLSSPQWADRPKYAECRCRCLPLRSPPPSPRLHLPVARSAAALSSSQRRRLRLRAPPLVRELVAAFSALEVSNPSRPSVLWSLFWSFCLHAATLYDVQIPDLWGLSIASSSLKLFPNLILPRHFTTMWFKFHSG